jgi:4-hydroxy-3-polyprenylbenzoate decarboxylase
MKYRDLRDFMSALERCGELKRVVEPVSTRLEMTAVSDCILRKNGPALWFQQPVGYKISALTNLFGTPKRVALGMGANDVTELRDVGRLLASLKEPEPPKGLKDAGKLLHMAKALWDMKPATTRSAPCQEVVLQGADVDLGSLPVQLCWPDDAGPLITWGLVITRGPQGGPAARARQNLGIYRQQVIAKNRVIMRWLAHRGGALDFRDFALARQPVFFGAGGTPGLA